MRYNFERIDRLSQFSNRRALSKMKKEEMPKEKKEEGQMHLHKIWI
jgi:hypothetical protein